MPIVQCLGTATDGTNVHALIRPVSANCKNLCAEGSFGPNPEGDKGRWRSQENKL